METIGALIKELSLYNDKTEYRIAVFDEDGNSLGTAWLDRTCVGYKNNTREPQMFINLMMRPNRTGVIPTTE